MFLTIKRKSIVAYVGLFILAVILISAVGVTSTASVFFGSSGRKIPVYGVEVDGEDKVIALTFDAAWGADKTQGILDIMSKYDAKGTFFLVGFWIDKFEAETKAIADAGFAIGNHSKNHLNMPKLSEDAIKDEISYVNDKVKDLTGITPKFFRAPYGDYDNKLRTVLEELGMTGSKYMKEYCQRQRAELLCYFTTTATIFLTLCPWCLQG